MAKQQFKHVFHSEATVADNGISIGVFGYKSLTITIIGTSATRTVTFYEKLEDGTLVALSGVKRSDFSTGSSTTGTNEIWQFDIVGANEIVMDLTAVAGGNVTVTGMVVAFDG